MADSSLIPVDGSTVNMSIPCTDGSLHSFNDLFLTLPHHRKLTIYLQEGQHDVLFNHTFCLVIKFNYYKNDGIRSAAGVLVTLPIVKFVKRQRSKCFSHFVRMNPTLLAARAYSMKMETRRGTGQLM